METQEPEKKTMSQRTKSILVGVLGLTAGACIAALVLREKDDDDFYLYRVNPDHLQSMIDKPESVVVFEEARVLVGNSASTEVL